MRKLDDTTFQPLDAALEDLKKNPKPDAAIPLQGIPKRHRPVYRLRVGDFRILYKVFDQELVVLVVEIATRQSVYDFLDRLKKMPPIEP